MGNTAAEGRWGGQPIGGRSRVWQIRVKSEGRSTDRMEGSEDAPIRALIGAVDA